MSQMGSKLAASVRQVKEQGEQKPVEDFDPYKAEATFEHNFLPSRQSLSATATLTAEYVAKIEKTSSKILDTRKTIPGMRFGQKYAVTCGGGTNHRIGLSDAYLIKENHILLAEAHSRDGLAGVKYLTAGFFYLCNVFSGYSRGGGKRLQEIHGTSFTGQQFTCITFELTKTIARLN